MENRVEKLRKERGLNQEDFAKAIRVSRQTVSSIEIKSGGFCQGDPRFQADSQLYRERQV